MEPSNPTQERRCIERIVLEAPLFADATFGDRQYEVAIIDFSNAGAKIQTVDGGTFGPYPAGQQCEFLVHLPSGKRIPFRASLSWSFRLPEGSLMGVQFIDAVDIQVLREMHECGTNRSDGQLVH